MLGNSPSSKCRVRLPDGWLNMTEIEFSVLNRQCLNRRISSPETLREEVEAWEQYRNQTSSPVD